jgi:glycosyltransferase involved in cell wall biosynthesis
MRVLMLSWEYTPHIVGGLGKHVVELIPALLRAGVEVHLVTPRMAGGPEVEEVTEGFTVHRVDPPMQDPADFFGSAQRANQSIGLHSRQVIRQFGGFDIIHAHDWLVGMAAIDLKYEFRLPLLATIHATEYGRNHGNIGTPIQRAIHNEEWTLTYEAWRVITCSQFMKNEVLIGLGTPTDKVDVIPNGVETGRFDSLEGVDLTDFRSRWAAPDQQIVFNVGRIVHEKGVQVLVEAAPAILAGRPNTRIIIAGTGGYLADLRLRAVALGVADRVHFAGFVSDEDRDRLFKVADVAVFPSLYEPFGIVALEAMAARTPVVVSDVGGFSEVVALHETGMTAYPDNPASLAWAVLQTLDHPDWADQRAEAAYRMVHTRYSWDTIAAQTINVYDRIALARRQVAW